VARPLPWCSTPLEAREALASTGFAALRGHFDAARCKAWSDGTLAARAEWTADFGDDQFSLGRAFYTHLEQDRSRAYFRDARASDARVDKHAPGLQSAMRELAALLTGGRVRQRFGWCGAGIHVFPAGAVLARNGGVVHFDTEGLTEHHIERGGRALSVVAMLLPPESGGGLRVWELTYEGEDHVPEEALAAPSVTAVYATGDVVAFDSYRLHQIQPFEGETPRISATIHLAEVDDGVWESWF
jgi:hypothetical protein